MIGFNGGLIGKDRTTTLLGAVGVWTLDEQIKAQRSGVWPVSLDPDAAAYIAAVEAADGQTLETGVRDAINVFVVGCKFDGIWSAIKASCILAGARTLTGALVPLVGAAPTNTNFVSGDYNRKTGLAGNGSTKHLNTNRAANVDPQNNYHISFYASTADNNSGGGAYDYMGTDGTSSSLGVVIGRYPAGGFGYSTSRNSSGFTSAGLLTATGFIGHSRNASATFTTRFAGSTTTTSITSNATTSTNIFLFARSSSTNVVLAGSYSNGRIAFYSIGESLGLNLLDARVATLISAYAAAIP